MLSRARSTVAAKAVRLDLPADLPGWKPVGNYDWAWPAAWVEAQARDMAAQFDIRNGNSHDTSQFADSAAICGYDADWPLRRQ